MNKCYIILSILLLVLASLPFLLKYVRDSQHAPEDPSIGTVDILSTKQLTHYFNGKNVLVVGGSRGVGYGIAWNLVESGANVWLAGRSQSSGDKAINLLKEKRVSEKQVLKFIQADLSTVRGSFAFIDKLNHENIKFNDIVVTIAVFPDWNDLLTEEKLEKFHATALLGRYILYKEIDKFFVKEDPRLMHVFVGGHKPSITELNRDLITGKKNVTSLLECIAHGPSAGDLILFHADKVLNSNVHITSTHPGFLITDLHRNQGILLDIFEKIVFALAGISEYDCGRKLTSVLASPKMLVKRLTFVDEDMIGRIKSNEISVIEKKDYDWLINFLDSHIAKYRK